MKFPFSPLLIALSLCATTNQATAVGRNVDMNVIDRDTGQQLQVYHYRGQNFVVGVPGNHYAINLRNLRGERVMTVVSVDGLNVISGETAHPNQTGYVLDPHGATEINGWRKDLNQVAAFIFANEPESYAARTGRPENVGVIGAAVFREKERPIRWREDRIAPAAPEAGSAADSSRQAPSKSLKRAEGADQPRLGTAHGEREQSQADYTDFTRARSTPDELISIRYDSYRNLVAMGVIPRHAPGRRPNPNPFPGQFVPDPN